MTQQPNEPGRSSSRARRATWIAAAPALVALMGSSTPMAPAPGTACAVSSEVTFALPFAPSSGLPFATPSALRAAPAPDPDPPAYYRIELVTTRNIPGTGYTKGSADVTYAPSPFVITVEADGSYRYDVRVGFEGLTSPLRGAYVAWATTTEIDEIIRLGTLDDQGRVMGQVSWNKFLVVITLEEDPDPAAKVWSGPIAFRGMSRSGRMHTMIGHGLLQEEKCAAYGYAN